MQKNKILTSKRMLWADIMRIVAIYLVVQLHTYQLPFTLSKITLLCIPLFIMLSGALLLEKEENYKIFFFKRCVKVLLPWIVWTGIYMIYFLYILQPTQISILYFNGKNTLFIEWLRYFYRMFLSALWFFPLIFSLYIITPVMRIFVRHARYFDNIYVLFLWFICLSIVPFLFHTALLPEWSPNIIYTLIQYSGYYLLGAFLIGKNKQLLRSRRMLYLFLIGFFMVFFSTNYLDPRTVIASIATFMLIIIFSNHMEKIITVSVRKLLTKVSGACLGIYVVHTLIATFFVNERVYLQSHHGEILFTFLLFVTSAVVVLILQKIPIIKHIVP